MFVMHIFWSLSYYYALYCSVLSDARLALKKYIAKVSAIVTDTAKGPGKLFKEDKVLHCDYSLL